jgi:N-acetylmuramoyl-L-alanine amidase
LTDRIAKIRNPEPAIFISIHADGARNRKASGSSVFILPRKGAEASSKYAKRLADKENKMTSNSNLKSDDDPAVYELKSDLTQRTTRHLSEQLGTNVLTHISKVNNLHKKKVEEANFAVLTAIDVCSILVETAFLSNSEEEKQLRTSAYQERLATAIFRGIKDFIRNVDPNEFGFKLSAQ